MPNSLFFIISYLAILKSGNICIPLDPSLEKENLQYIIELTNPSLIFINSSLKKNYDLTGIELLDENILKNTVKPLIKIKKEFDYERVAEIIFTSGSTGVPKGVMITHKNLITNTDSIISSLDLRDNDRMLAILPFHYCYGLSLLHTHLRVGGSIVLNNSFMFLGSVIKDLLFYQCTGFAGVPSHFQMLLRMSDSFKKTTFPALRYVSQAGGALPSVFIDEFREIFQDIDFFVMYGQTEATARLACLPSEIYKRKKGSVGKAIPGVQLAVINKKGELLDSDITGEIVARGNNIMKGYLGDSIETEKVLKDGWLHTGDLGYIDSDGYVFLVGREKEILKLRGRRISPKEIESVILELHYVIDCSLTVIHDDNLGEALYASIVLKAGYEFITSDAIQKHCLGKLSLYKIPVRFELKEKLDIKLSGKKNRSK